MSGVPHRDPVTPAERAAFTRTAQPVRHAGYRPHLAIDWGQPAEAVTPAGALHGYLDLAEQLARLLRVASAGQLTLTVAAPATAVSGSARAKAGILGWGDAHDRAEAFLAEQAPIQAEVIAEYARQAQDADAEEGQ